MSSCLILHDSHRVLKKKSCKFLQSFYRKNTVLQVLPLLVWWCHLALELFRFALATHVLM